MSTKLNISEIITGHFKTLKSANGKTSFLDFLVFIAIPIILAVISAILKADLNAELRSLLVNFGAIFTALLLSVLVLVYDQESKYSSIKSNDPIANRKNVLIRELHYNISYSIVCSIGLVIFSMSHTLLGSTAIKYTILFFAVDTTLGVSILTPLVIFFSLTIFLNVLMIVKRMHVLLTS